ncbi:MAG: DUF2332 domain-containing protein [Candidatus Cybelea sp.]
MASIAKRLAVQARTCGIMGSPFMADLIQAALSDYRKGGEIRDLLDSYPHYRRPGLNLAAALHYLALDGEPTLLKHYPSVGGDGDGRAAWNAGRAILAQHRDQVAQLFTGNVQTNEPARSMPILVAFLWLAARFNLPVRAFEVGASAGLNLRFDRYRYEEPDWSWGDADSALVLRNATERGRPKNLRADLNVTERRGCDLSPIDLNSKNDRLRLQSFVWPDQADRFDRLRAAIQAAADTPVNIDAEGFSTWLRREARCREGYVTVVVHTLFEEHLTAKERAELNEAIAAFAAEASPRAPVARVRMELTEGNYSTEVTTWSDSSLATTICTSDGHAQRIIWM